MKPTFFFLLCAVSSAGIVSNAAAQAGNEPRDLGRGGSSGWSGSGDNSGGAANSSGGWQQNANAPAGSAGANPDKSEKKSNSEVVNSGEKGGGSNGGSSGTSPGVGSAGGVGKSSGVGGGGVGSGK